MPLQGDTPDKIALQASRLFKSQKSAGTGKPLNFARRISGVR
jgi:hypothetical protein